MSDHGLSPEYSGSQCDSCVHPQKEHHSEQLGAGQGACRDPADVSKSGFYAVQSSTGQCQAWSQMNEISSFVVEKLDSSHRYTLPGSLHLTSSFAKLSGA